jgi:hypothetical protein
MREGVVVQRSCLVQPLCSFDLRQTPKLASFGVFADQGGAYALPYLVNAGDGVLIPPKHSGVSGFVFLAPRIEGKSVVLSALLDRVFFSTAAPRTKLLALLH